MCQSSQLSVLIRGSWRTFSSVAAVIQRRRWADFAAMKFRSIYLVSIWLGSSYLTTLMRAIYLLDLLHN